MTPSLRLPNFISCDRLQAMFGFRRIDDAAASDASAPVFELRIAAPCGQVSLATSIAFGRDFVTRACFLCA